MMFGSPHCREGWLLKRCHMRSSVTGCSSVLEASSRFERNDCEEASGQESWGNEASALLAVVMGISRSPLVTGYQGAILTCGPRLCLVWIKGVHRFWSVSRRLYSSAMYGLEVN